MSSEIEPVTYFVDLIDKWKAEHQNEGYDPLPFLTRCSEILHSALTDFLAKNPDPYGKRHPKHVLSESKFGKLVKVLEDCREFNDMMTSKYLKTNASPKNVGRVVVTSARLAVLAGKGYRITGLDTEEYVNVLISWIIYANEPLRTYATGLINGCCVVKKSTNVKSIKLITTLLKRLWNYLEQPKYKQPESIVLKEDQNVSNPRKRKHSPDFTSEINSHLVVRDGDIANIICVNDLNNSSRVEQMPAMLGVNYWLEKPLTASLCQCYTFHLLKCFGKLQEFQSTFYECKVLLLIGRYLEIKSEDNLVYKALEFLSTLICHDKAATDFIELDGIQKLIDIPRPSMASTGVAMCFYNLACRKQAMKKIHQSPAHILRELMNYAIWLLECSHETGKSHIALFFCMAFSDQKLLSLYDDMNGLRYLVNMISTTKYIIRADDDEYDPREDPDLPYTTSQTIKYACVALMKYFEAHVVFKVGQLVKSCPVLKRKYPTIERVTKYETATHTTNKHLEYLDVLQESAGECDDFNLESWAPIALFQRLDGISLLLKIINDTHELKVTVPAQFEVGQAALYVLCAVTLSHSCQIMLTKCYPTLGLDIIGLHVILDFIESLINIKQVTYADGNLLNCAIAVLANCTESTCAKSIHGNESMNEHDSPRYNTKKRDVETLCKLIWQADGIKTLLIPLGVTYPAQTADFTRYLACKALVGLAEYQPVRQILPKLHVLTSKLLPVIQEPALKYKKDLHVKFYNNLKILLEKIVKMKVITLEIDLKTALRSDVVTGTRERYDNEDVLLMIYIRLISSGFDDNPPQLTQEAEINNMFVIPKSVKTIEIGERFVTETSKFSRSHHFAHPVTFNSITEESFRNQHSKCGNPVVTEPPFSLFTHHHCPKPRNKIEASVNILKRHCYRQGVYRKWGGIGGMEQDLRMIYSRFRPIAVIRSTNDRESHFTAVAIDPNSDCKVILGDMFGNVHFHEVPKFEDGVTIKVFDSSITYIEPSKAGDVMLTQSWLDHDCAILAMNDTLDVKLTFESIDFVEFSKTVQDKIVASTDGRAIICDANTGTIISTYGKDAIDCSYSEYKLSCYYEMNRATFSYDDRLVLSNGCLWDVRKPQTLPVHRFFKFNDAISGVFHPNDLEVIINTEVWDMRNYNLIQTVPPLDQCQLLFNRNRSVMYATKIGTNKWPGEISSFRTFDSSNYNQLGFIALKQQVSAIALDDCDRNIAMIETPDAEYTDMYECRIYEVGAMRDDDEEK